MSDDKARSEATSLDLARQISAWDQGVPETRSVPHWAMNLAMELMESDWLVRHDRATREEAFVAGSEWQKTQPLPEPTDEQIEAVALVLTEGEGPLARTHFFGQYRRQARAAIEAYRKAVQ